MSVILRDWYEENEKQAEETAEELLGQEAMKRLLVEFFLRCDDSSLMEVALKLQEYGRITRQNLDESQKDDWEHA